MGSSMSTSHSMEHVPDDALSEVLRRVPPHPATLARASLACKRLRSFIGDPGFLRTFQAHHGPPPLLGFFYDDQTLPNTFLPIGDGDGDSPEDDRVSAPSFDPTCSEREDEEELAGYYWRCVDSRHGRVLLLLLRSPDDRWARFLVWDPAAGRRRRYIDAPPPTTSMIRFSNAAVVCGCAAAPGHVDGHSDCHDSPFSVVLVAAAGPDGRGQTVVYLYSSELGLWNQVASTDLSTSWICVTDRPAALVRNVLYWTMVTRSSGLESCILGFDLGTHALSLIEQPVYFFDAERGTVQVMEAEDGLLGLGLVAACGLCLQLWVLHEYDSGSSGTERWEMHRQIDLDDLALGPFDPMELYEVWILSVDGRVVYVRTEAGIFAVDQDTVVPNKRICDAYDIQAFYPYRSFYYRGGAGALDGSNAQS